MGRPKPLEGLTDIDSSRDVERAEPVGGLLDFLEEKRSNRHRLEIEGGNPGQLSGIRSEPQDDAS